MNEKADFICFNNDGFDGLRRPRHILMERLAGMGFNVLFVSAPVKYISQRFSRPRLKLGGMVRLGPRFHWYQPPAILPVSPRPLLGKAAAFLRKTLLRGVIKALTGRRRIFFVSVPERDYIEVLHAHRTSTVVYNVHDRFFDKNGHWVDGHDELMRRADIVLAGSRIIVDELQRSYGKLVHFFPPGVDFDMFPRAYGFAPRRATDGVVVGCIGNMGNQIDWALLKGVATVASHLEFRLIGPVVKAAHANPSYHELQALPNVTFMGEIPHAQVAEVMRSLDVCIMPYALNAYTEGVGPLKAYEYFTQGKPVVSTPIAATAEYRDLIYIGSDVREWVECLRQAAEENDEAKFLARRDFALAQDYAARVAFVKSILDLERPGQGGMR